MTNAITNASFIYSSSPRVSANELSESEGSAIREFSWKQARRIKDGLANEVEKKGVDNPIALLKYVPDMPKFFQSQVGKPRPASVEVSNLGIWRRRAGTDAEEWKGNWRIERMAISQSMNHTSAPISVSTVTGGDGCLSMTFCWIGGNNQTGGLTWALDFIRDLRKNIVFLAHEH
jgi:hypothetical protein